eukprot:m.75023 g.75023  ORF g.75023 m.75023 type:complete len:94 (+) comp13118_c0_seq2:3044-3325(+)
MPLPSPALHCLPFFVTLLRPPTSSSSTQVYQSRAGRSLAPLPAGSLRARGEAARARVERDRDRDEDLELSGLVCTMMPPLRTRVAAPRREDHT